MRRVLLEAFKGLNSANVQKTGDRTVFEGCSRCWKAANLIDFPDKQTFVTESYHSISFFLF